MLIKVMNMNNDMILVNTDHIVKVRPYKDGIIIRLTNDESEERIPDMTVEEFLVKTRETQNDFSKMATAICERISHLEDAVAAGTNCIVPNCN